MKLAKSADQLQAELVSTLELLRQAHPFVGKCASIGAQQLSVKIKEHFAMIRQEKDK